MLAQLSLEVMTAMLLSLLILSLTLGYFANAEALITNTAYYLQSVALHAGSYQAGTPAR